MTGVSESSQQSSSLKDERYIIQGAKNLLAPFITPSVHQRPK
ncbi:MULTISPECIES: hypothetical protein [Photorhabdus]|nr:hypothetical protein [Photorhabdus asymbiotica]